MTPLNRKQKRPQWLASICSTSVEPVRVIPTRKIGSHRALPQPLRVAKNSGVDSVLQRAGTVTV
jgi:hypothetical protein